MSMKLGIVVITYNRLKSVMRLVESIQNAWYDGDEVDLIISVDKSKDDEVERWAETVSWTHGTYRLIKHEKNLGLRAHVLECGNRVKDYDAIAVFEDDVTVSPNFYRFAKQCVEKYQHDNRIAGIGLFNWPLSDVTLYPFVPLQSGYDVYFMNVAVSWGQVWMKKQWNDFYEWYMADPSEFPNAPHLNDLGEWPKNSWLKYHMKYCIEENKYFVYPYHALSTCNADPGTHAGVTKRTCTFYQTEMLTCPKTKYQLPSFEECMVKYDGFFQPKFLASYLGVKEEDLCVDFYGMKGNVEGKRYWLTLRPQPYKIVDSYDIGYKPYENNIILNRKGDLMFLYDTTLPARSPKPDLYYWHQYMYLNGYRAAFRLMGHTMPLRIIFGDYLLKRLKRVGRIVCRMCGKHS